MREAAMAALPGLLSPSLDDVSGLAFNTATTLVVEQAWAIVEAFVRQEAVLWVKLEAAAKDTAWLEDDNFGPKRNDAIP